MKLLFFFAFSEEVREIIRIMGPGKIIEGLPFKARSLTHSSHELTMVETGLGVENAGRVFLHMVEKELPDAVFSLGYCGALSPQASVGDVIWASRVCLIEGESLESLSLPDDLKLFEKVSSRIPVREGTFITMKEWIKKKNMIHFVSSEMTLPVCDMETFALARLCEDRRLPFFAMRAVSDGADTDLPFDPWSVCDNSGVYRVTRALTLFLARPHLLAHGIELFRNSKIASRNLGRAVSVLFQLL
jgi:nucleoside phosphorylase